jgi:DNA ligase-associated metallophosphoesterase
MDAELEIRGHAVRLLAERAVFLSGSRTLIVADTHWGKDATFRAAAVPIPPEVQAEGLARLERALARTKAVRLLVLGDLLHTRHAYRRTTSDAVLAWRQKHAGLTVTVVAGNHDRAAGPPPTAWNLDMRIEAIVEGDLVFRHDPAVDRRGYVFCGHLHPKVLLSGHGKQTLERPCFWFREAYGVLPAFSTFTGGARVRPAESDRVFVIADNEVIQITSDSLPASPPAGK